MAIERVGGTNLADVVERILDKGIVIDVWVCVALVGIDILTVEARVVIASVDTFLKYADAIRQIPPVVRPALETERIKALAGQLASLPVPRPAGRRAIQGRH